MPPRTSAPAARISNERRQPNASTSCAERSGTMKLPTPMPATARPEASPRFAMNHGCTAPTLGT